jgi:hypothetical protein
MSQEKPSIKEYVPFLTSKAQSKAMEDFFGSDSVYLGLALTPLVDEGSSFEFVEPSIEIYSRCEAQSWAWNTLELNPIKSKTGTEFFRGVVFYNQLDIKLQWKDPTAKAKIYAFGLFDQQEGGSLLLYGNFSQSIDLGSPVPPALTLPSKSIVGFFGRGSYIPTLEDCIAHSSSAPGSGCPFKDPNTCKYKGDAKVCSFARKDGLCTKTVQLFAQCCPAAAGNI